jgi:peroxiredoxin
MPELQQLQQAVSGQGFEVVTVAVQDNPQRVQELRDQMKLSFPILLDPKGLVRDTYKVNGYPETFILDKEGKIVLFPDPETRDPRARIIGPRAWSSPGFMSGLKLLF